MIRNEYGAPESFTIGEIILPVRDLEFERLQALYNLASGNLGIEDAVGVFEGLGERNLVDKLRKANTDEITKLEHLYTPFPGAKFALSDGSEYAINEVHAGLFVASEIAIDNEQRRNNPVLWTMVHGYMENDDFRSNKALDGSFIRLLELMGFDFEEDDPNDTSVHAEFDLKRFVIDGQCDVVYLQAQDTTA